MTLLLALAIVLFLSAFFSAAEMAFLSTDRVKLRDQTERGDLRAGQLLLLFEDSREFLTTVLIGNNLMNVLAAALLTAFLETRWEIHSEWVITGILAPILIVLCETVPKGYGRHRGQGFLTDHLNLVLFFWKFLGAPARILLSA